MLKLTSCLLLSFGLPFWCWCVLVLSDLLLGFVLFRCFELGLGLWFGVCGFGEFCCVLGVDLCCFRCLLVLFVLFGGFLCGLSVWVFFCEFVIL